VVYLNTFKLSSLDEAVIHSEKKILSFELSYSDHVHTFKNASFEGKKEDEFWSSGKLRSVDLQLVRDVSEELITSFLRAA
jgi:hypothetical protein